MSYGIGRRGQGGGPGGLAQDRQSPTMSQDQARALAHSGPFLKVLHGTFAGNGYVDFTPSLGVRWDLVWFRMRLATDATAGTRHIFCTLRDPDLVVLGPVMCSDDVVASQTYIGVLKPTTDDPAAGALCEAVDQFEAQYLNFPITLTDKMRLRFQILNGYVGDAATVSLIVWETLRLR